MDARQASRRPPRSVSKQKSCGQLPHHDNSKIENRYKRGCLTPNAKTTTPHSLPKSDSSSSKTELKSYFKTTNCTESADSRIRSNLRKTPRSNRTRINYGTTPRSTLTGFKNSPSSCKGKAKRNFDKEKDMLRPKKRLAISYKDDDINSNDDQCGTVEDRKGKNIIVLENKSHTGSNLITIAEVNSLAVIRDLNKTHDIKEQEWDGDLANENENNCSTKADSALETHKISKSIHHEEQIIVPDVSQGDVSVKVAVRVRPFTKREVQNKQTKCVVEVQGNAICVTDNNDIHHDFTFDMAFSSFDQADPGYANQETVYALFAKPLLDGVLKGYNTCLFAYGQTGSGKSYTMTGYEAEDAGIIPRFSKELLQQIETDRTTRFSMEISFFEIYNERIRDLLTHSQDQTKQLRLREHPDQGPYVQDLSIFTVTCWEDIEGWLTVGNRSRATAATGMNDRSSRSHSVFTMLISQFETEVFEDTETQVTRTSKVNLIDLAGSERANQVVNEDFAADNETITCRLKEGSCINRSLHTLGKVISLLSETQTEPRKKLFVPYRESTLTWLLKESLGGNSRTAMMAAISPASVHLAESLSTLRYARQARNIVNQARVNEDANAKMIRELLREIDRLKSTKGDANNESMVPVKAEIEALKDKLTDANEKLVVASREWEAKLKLSESRWKEETERIKQSGIASQIENTLPCLVNLNEDPMLSEVLVYVLKLGSTTFGNSLSKEAHDIQLIGPLVADNHCYITNEKNDVKISPVGDAPVYVNGEQISSSVVLKHGDRIVIGGTHFFRFNQPAVCMKESYTERRSEAATLIRRPSKRELRRKWDGLTLKDFDFAKRELSHQQNDKLEAELQESQVKAQEGLIALITNVKETAEKQLSLQKDAYKDDITDLQKRLEDAECQRRIAEKNRILAEDRLIQLKSHQQALEEEIQNNRRRLQEETSAAQKAFEETRAGQLQIIAELESEKQKIEDDVNTIKNRKAQRNMVRDEIRSVMSVANGERPSAKKDILKIALLLREANKISEKLRKHVTFSRDDILENDKVEIGIRLNDTRNGRTTLWSLDKFEVMVGKMRDLYQANGRLDEGEEDPFYESIDEWMDDFILDSPSIPDAGTNCSRVSFGRRQSLNHSLHVLTNLNASLSELSKRRKSSAIHSGMPVLPARSEELHEPLVSLATVYERMFGESFNYSSNSICKRMMTILLQTNEEIMRMDHNAEKPGVSTKHTPGIAVLLMRLLECGKIWDTMQVFVSNVEEIRLPKNNLNEAISRLISECKILFQPWPRVHSINGIKDALTAVVSGLGGISLIAVDCIEGQSDAALCYINMSTDMILYKSFLQGQQGMWFLLIIEWSNEMDNLLQALRNLQLAHSNNGQVDLDLIVNLLNSSLTMFASMKEFLVCWFESFCEEDSCVFLTESTLYNQRGLIGISVRLTNKLKCLVSSVKNAVINSSHDMKTIYDALHSVMKLCRNSSKMVGKLAGVQKIPIDWMSSSTIHFQEKFEKVQFASKTIQVGVAVISQKLDEFCIREGRRVVYLDCKEDEVDISKKIAMISPFQVHYNED